MRLIDADDLKRDLLTWFPPTVCKGLTAQTMLKQIITDIDNQPTVSRLTSERMFPSLIGKRGNGGDDDATDSR